MSREKPVDRLADLGELILDLRMNALQSAVRARQESLDRLAGLSGAMPQTDLPLVASHRAEVRYQAWADARRTEINLILARQTARMLEDRDAARLAFGRAQALRGLRD